MLTIWFEPCRAYGITELLHSHADAVCDFVKKHSHGSNVHIYEEPVLRGSAGTILANRKWVQQEESFRAFYVDVLTNANLSRMLAFHPQKQQLATIGVNEPIHLAGLTPQSG